MIDRVISIDESYIPARWEDIVANKALISHFQNMVVGG